MTAMLTLARRITRHSERSTTATSILANNPERFFPLPSLLSPVWKAFLTTCRPHKREANTSSCLASLASLLICNKTAASRAQKIPCCRPISTKGRKSIESGTVKPISVNNSRVARAAVMCARTRTSLSSSNGSATSRSKSPVFCRARAWARPRKVRNINKAMITK